MHLSHCRTLRAEVFARLPDEFRIKGRRSPRVGGQRAQAKETHSFLEGPAFDQHGNLYVVDIPWGRIFRFDSGGRCELALAYDGEPCGLKFRADGKALCTDQKRGLVELDLSAKTVRSLVERHFSEGFRGLNDLCVSRQGDVYFTDQGLSDLVNPTGRVHCLGVDGILRTVLSSGPSPNGIALSPDENTLFVAMTRANSVWRCPLMVDGSSAKVGAFVNLSGGIGPDGIAIDESGGLVVAHGGAGVVWVFDRRGDPMLRIESPVGDLVTNIAFGGADRRTLYITESHTGTILVAPVDVPGVNLMPT